MGAEISHVGKCGTCGKPAMYAHSFPQANRYFRYCEKHVPEFVLKEINRQNAEKAKQKGTTAKQHTHHYRIAWLLSLGDIVPKIATRRLYLPFALFPLARGGRDWGWHLAKPRLSGFGVSPNPPIPQRVWRLCTSQTLCAYKHLFLNGRVFSVTQQFIYSLMLSSLQATAQYVKGATPKQSLQSRLT